METKRQIRTNEEQVVMKETKQETEITTKKFSSVEKKGPLTPGGGGKLRARRSRDEADVEAAAKGIGREGAETQAMRARAVQTGCTAHSERPVYEG